MVLFETEHLIIRELLESDLEGFHDLHSNANVMRPIPAPTMDLNECAASIKSLIKSYSELENKLFVYAIILKSNNDFAGTCATVKIRDGVNEIGYRIREKYWRQGFGAEVNEHLINYLFEKTEVIGLVADVDSKNIASIKILDKFLKRVNETYDEKTQIRDYHYSLKREH